MGNYRVYKLANGRKELIRDNCTLNAARQTCGRHYDQYPNDNLQIEEIKGTKNESSS